MLSKPKIIISTYIYEGDMFKIKYLEMTMNLKSVKMDLKYFI